VQLCCCFAVRSCCLLTYCHAISAQINDDVAIKGYSDISLCWGWTKTDTHLNYVHTMPSKLQNTRYLYLLHNFNICYSLYSLNVLIYWKYCRNSVGTLVFRHTQIVNQTAFIVSWSNIVTKLQFIRIQTELGRRTTSFNDKKAQLTQRERATAVHVWRPTANKCKIRKKTSILVLKVIQGHCFRCQSKPVYDFLLVIHCNVGPISHRFRDMATFRSKSIPPRAVQPFKVIQGRRSWS